MVRNMIEEKRRWVQGRGPGRVEKLHEEYKRYFSKLEDVVDAGTCRMYF